MFTFDDLVDAILEEIPRRSNLPAGRRAAERASFGPGPYSSAGAAPASNGGPPAWSDTGPRGRRFLSEYDVKRMLTPGSQVLKIPRDAILSPLAQDWLALKGIRALPQ